MKDEHNNEYDNENDAAASAWMLTYSDLMSLLLCFFIMLYAVSTVQETKFQSATESLRGGFGLFGNAASFNIFPPKSKSKKDFPNRKIGGTILFETGSEDLTETAKQELDTIFQQFAETPLAVQITAASLSNETTIYRRDIDLAHARGIAVWDYLISLGIHPERCRLVLRSGKDEGAFVEIHSAPQASK